MRNVSVLLFLILGGLISSGVASSAEVMREDPTHVNSWNAFANHCYKLHLKQLEGREYTVKTSIGGYYGNENFYRQEDYYDAETGLLLSTLQWERENPENLHSVAVYVYGEDGKVIRDYSATYLPHYRNAPSQTLIFLHRYNDGTHAFRSFDASGDRIYEQCQGEINGEGVMLSLESDDIDEAIYQLKQNGGGTMASPVYKHCFGDLEEAADEYLIPK
ncbi:MAG TPA: hypothetical protein ENJ01_01275 [Gammaproteobacteria bacterium]|nr:hypothetical protein [Gammaproteobacteria bacterium]